MTTKYQQTYVTGEQWTRARRIVVDNTLGETPCAKFVEEEVVNVSGGGQFSRDAGILEVKATDSAMEELIPIVDPATGEPTGDELSFSEVHRVLHSAYFHFANLRDNPPDPEEPEYEDPDDEDQHVEEEGEDG